MLFAEKNQNPGNQSEDRQEDAQPTETDSEKSHESNENEINSEDEHSKIFSEVHGVFVIEPIAFCTQKKTNADFPALDLNVPTRSRQLRGCRKRLANAEVIR